MKTKAVILLLVLAWAGGLRAQIMLPDSVYRPRRIAWVAGVEGALWSGSMVGLWQAWYKDYNTGTMHGFDDSGEWLQVDKAGHATTSYFLGKIGYDMLRWAGAKENYALTLGGGLGFFYLSTVEVLDGFSKGWGFSWSDMAANATGTALFIGQQAGWHEQRIFLKFSYHYTQYAQYRPNILGSNWAERIIKDYNGHTYWLSANICSFLPKQSHFPRWLNVAAGYGAEGMLGGYGNPDEVNGGTVPKFDRYRQFYLSLDVDLTRIPTRSKFLRGLFNTLSFIKIPMPTVEFSKKGTKFYPLYF